MVYLPEKASLISWCPALASGLLMTAAFPTASVYWLAWIALVPLLVSIHGMEPRQAFNAGLVCGMAHFLTLIYWIVPTIHRYGGIPLVLAVPVLVMFCLYLAGYIAVFTWSLARLNRHPWSMPIKAALTWVGLEYLRSFLLTGFPWGLLGYSQYTNTTLIQIADTTGVYGVSFILALSNGVIAWGYTAFRTSRSLEKPLHLRGILSWTFVLALMTASTLTYGARALNKIDQQSLSAKSVAIKVAQGNINQTHKWEKNRQARTVDRYCTLSQPKTNEQLDLVVWPETAMPFYYSWDKDLSDVVNQCIRNAKTSFLFGSPAFEGDENAYKIFNRAYMVNEFGIVTGSYDKVHLVPFGEYVPFGKYLTFLGKLTHQAGDFSPGPEDTPPLEFASSSAGVLICFEVIFAPLARDHVKNGAEILVTMTNDAWFGWSSAPEQHFSVAVFRAVENRRSVVRAANTGISGFIDPGGRILEATGLFESAGITHTLPCLDEITGYTRAGDLFALACLGAAMAGCWACRPVRARSKTT